MREWTRVLHSELYTNNRDICMIIYKFLNSYDDDSNLREDDPKYRCRS